MRIVVNRKSIPVSDFASCLRGAPRIIILPEPWEVYDVDWSMLDTNAKSKAPECTNSKLLSPGLRSLLKPVEEQGLHDNYFMLHKQKVLIPGTAQYFQTAMHPHVYQRAF